MPPGGKHIVTCSVVSKSELHVYLNGVLNDSVPGGHVWGSGVGSYSTTEPVRLAIDGAAGDCDGYGVGDVYAIRVYSPAPDAIERAEIEAELAARYGITL